MLRNKLFEEMMSMTEDETKEFEKEDGKGKESSKNDEIELMVPNLRGHGKRLKDLLYQQWTTQQHLDLDVILHLDRTESPNMVHGVVLWEHSGYFRKYLKHGQRNFDLNRVKQNEPEKWTLSEEGLFWALNWMYAGRIEVRIERIWDLFWTAQHLEMPSLIKYLDDYLLMKGGAERLEDLELCTLLRVAMNVPSVSVIARNTLIGVLVASKDFLRSSKDSNILKNLPFEAVLNVVEHPTNACSLSSETLLLDFVIRWLRANPAESKVSNATLLLNGVRFYSMSNKELDESEQMLAKCGPSFHKLFLDGIRQRIDLVRLRRQRQPNDNDKEMSDKFGLLNINKPNRAKQSFSESAGQDKPVLSPQSKSSFHERREPASGLPNCHQNNEKTFVGKESEIENNQSGIGLRNPCSSEAAKQSRMLPERTLDPFSNPQKRIPGRISKSQSTDTAVQFFDQNAMIRANNVDSDELDVNDEQRKFDDELTDNSVFYCPELDDNI